MEEEKMMERNSLLHVEDARMTEDVITVSARVLLGNSSQLKGVLLHEVEGLLLKELLFLLLQDALIGLGR